MNQMLYMHIESVMDVYKLHKRELLILNDFATAFYSFLSIFVELCLILYLYAHSFIYI